MRAAALVSAPGPRCALPLCTPTVPAGRCAAPPAPTVTPKLRVATLLPASPPPPTHTHTPNAHVPPPPPPPAVRNRLEKKSMNNILIRLRQACCHPYLLPGQEPEVRAAAADPRPLLWPAGPPSSRGCRCRRRVLGSAPLAPSRSGECRECSGILGGGIHGHLDDTIPSNHWFD